ncbi:putative 2OG-Fe(II) oxygenase [Alteromonas sp. KUL49]|uniref:putative 2OG-Fe(II) oxygenase n=1 Tax=Alteromonas sp. KUL49 TaxID=2480798 RepID=UPI00102F0FCD|nr:putative 2OG-Fe(II) oxygenase [Alteromonas sp. KUL49]TAP39771.1 hypothetical protein EYS00_10655 [Alteromonas sp. KUL49]GEA11770.1 hypothetical protein KUL49_21450 [Alteromonas sp. KUL49]
MNSSVQQYVNSAMQLMQQGNYSGALKIFLALEKAGMKDFRLFRTIGVAYERIDDLSAACNYFKRSLELNAGQADLMESLGKLFLKQDKVTEAQSWLEREYRLYPSASACYRYARMFLRQDFRDLEKLDQLLTKGIDEYGCTESLGLLKAQLLGERSEWNTQLHLLTELRERYPKNSLVLRAIAWAYKQTGNSTKAIQSYNTLLSDKSTATADDLERLALIHFELSQLPQAIRTLETGILQFPNNRALYRVLSSIRYENGESSFLSDYEKSLSKLPLELGLDYADKSINAKELERAEEILSQLEKRFGNQDVIKNRLANLAYEQQQDERCIELVSDLLVKTPDAIALLERRALASLALGDLSQSGKDIKSLLASRTDQQFFWALQSVQWRLEQDERYKWLCDYETLVKTSELSTKECEEPLVTYIHALKEELTKLHQAKKHPLEQSLRGGTQTPGNLLLRNDNTFKILNERLSRTVESELSLLSKDETHPTLSRRLTTPIFSASWSVMLKNQGYHRSHVHPKGWYSSAFYVSVPEVVSSDEDKQGWLKFGEPGIRLYTPLKAEYWVKPEAGKLALFPSFFWHGTEPYTSQDSRLSVAFDLLPSAHQ